jgi:Xaa-Pro aminopeptidase
MAILQPTADSRIPFDAVRLDQLMEAAGIDVLIATSKHNVQYLLGGHRFSFFDTMDATVRERCGRLPAPFFSQPRICQATSQEPPSM